jgi:isocitrate dehydrogenase (NAD+)
VRQSDDWLLSSTSLVVSGFALGAAADAVADIVARRANIAVKQVFPIDCIGISRSILQACSVKVWEYPQKDQQETMSNLIRATLIPGDGIGPEIMQATLAALEALDAPFEWDWQVAGLAGMQAAGDPVPQATMDSIRSTRLALKGPLETPSGGGYRSANVRLREAFKLFANVRPAKTIIPGGRYENIDLLVFRENVEGLYMGYEHFIPMDGDPEAVAIATGVNTRQGSRRLLEYAFESAIALGRKKVTIVHKANIMKALTGIFLDEARKLYKAKYQGKIEMNEAIVDACSMKLVLNPWQFDTLVTTNLFGDIISDLVAGLVGGLGMAPGGNIGEDAAVFEAVHGSAPDIAGKGIANPIALMLGAAMMLDHVKLNDKAARLRKAIDDTLNIDKIRTGDLGGTANTKTFTDALIARIHNG